MKNSKKRIKQVVFIGCIIALSFFVLWSKKREEDRFLGLKEISVQEKNRIMEKRRMEKSSLLDDLYFNQEKIIKDKDNIYYLPLSDKEEWEKGRITGNKEGVNICVVTAGKRKKKQEYQSEGEALELLIYDEESCLEASLLLTAFPVAAIDFLDCPEEIALKEEEIYSQVYFYVPKQERKKRAQAIHSYGLVHKRGGSSREFEKCGLKLELIEKNGKKRKENICGLRKDDDWILIPMYTEESKLRDKFCIDLWREIAGGEKEDNRGTQMEYVELVLNGTYYGLYGLAVPLDKKQLGLKEQGEKSDILFRIDTTQGADLTALEQAGMKKSAGNITVKFPKSMNQEKWNTIREFLGLVYFEEDRVFAKEIEDWVEMENMADFYLFLNVIYGKDNTLKNMYYCMRMKEDGTYQVSLLPWDMDLSLGTLYDTENQNGLCWKYETTENLETKECACYLTKRLRNLNVGEFEGILRERYRELRQDILQEERLSKQIERLSERVINSGAFYRDKQAWQESGHSTDYSIMREAIRRRLTYLSDLEG